MRFKPFTPDDLVIKGTRKKSYYYFYLHQYSGMEKTKAKIYTTYEIMRMINFSVLKYTNFMVSKFNAEREDCEQGFFLKFRNKQDAINALEWIKSASLVKKLVIS